MTAGPDKTLFLSKSPKRNKNEAHAHTDTRAQTHTPQAVPRILSINEAVNEIVTDVWWRGERRCGGDGGKLEGVGRGGANEVQTLDGNIFHTPGSQNVDFF